MVRHRLRRGAISAILEETMTTQIRKLGSLFARLVREDAGGEVLEYALIAGLIVVAAIAVIGTVGTKVLARWTSLDSSI